jgi:hypothetical protein
LKIVYDACNHYFQALAIPFFAHHLAMTQTHAEDIHRHSSNNAPGTEVSSSLSHVPMLPTYGIYDLGDGRRGALSAQGGQAGLNVLHLSLLSITETASPPLRKKA